MKRAVVGAVLIALILIVLSPLLFAQDARKDKPPKAPPPKGEELRKEKPNTLAKEAKEGNKGKKGRQLGPYARQRGTRIAGGVCYVGANHRPWTQRFFSRAWRLWFLFDPNTQEWFFWHPRLRMYLPVSYLGTAPPPLQPANVTPEQALKNTVPINVNNVPKNDNAVIPNLPAPNELAKPAAAK